MFQNVCVLQPTLVGALPPCQEAVDQLSMRGAQRIRITGCSCIAMARNMLMTSALLNAPEECSVFLLVDGDISFSVEDALVLVQYAEQHDKLISGIYGSLDGTIAHCKSPAGTWRIGLGLAAISRKFLQQIADGLELTRTKSEFWPFCQARVNDAGEWLSEDYWFSDLCGGAVLLPAIGKHWKTIGIVPDEATIERLM